MTNYVFGDDLKFFVKHLPSLPNRDEIAEKILIHTNARIKRHKREKIRQIEKRKLTRMYGK